MGNMHTTSKKHSNAQRSHASNANIIASEKQLNGAFDGLNRCQYRTQSVPEELSQIISQSVASGAVLYNQARVLHRAGKFQLSRKYSKIVCELCTLLNNLAEADTENIMGLSLPPKMMLLASQKKARGKYTHQSLRSLESFIIKRMTHVSAFYKAGLIAYPLILADVSKKLFNLENLH